MSIKSRVRRLQSAGKAWIRQKRQERAAEAERLAFHQQCIAAGIQPLDDRGNLAYGDWDKYCEFYGLDYDRERHDMPCASWVFKRDKRSMHMVRIVYWYNQLERGELTREEYHRLVLEFAARLEAEGSSSSGG